jgi:hypothetical protein
MSRDLQHRAYQRATMRSRTSTPLTHGAEHDIAASRVGNPGGKTWLGKRSRASPDRRIA